MKPFLGVVLGTRPELIKCAPVILEAQRRGLPVGIIHTGQHYSSELDGVFFSELNLPEPVAHVHVGSHPASRQIGLMMQRLHDVFDELRPEIVMVEGDTNSVLAGALAAYKSNIPVAHLEAGLRSDDWDMPEESNRVLADRLSKWLFCPTDLQRQRLLKEGIDHDGVHVVGNTIVDASLHYTKVAYDKSDIAERLGVTNRPYALLTMHRPSNVDDPARLRAILSSIGDAARTLGLMVVFPVHPRTKAAMDAAHLSLGDPFILTEPVGYLDLLRLQSSADVVLTDSGGIQEEACILRVPCVTLRANTERPETLDAGSNALHFEAYPASLADTMRRMMAKARDWTNPFGDGTTAVKVLDILKR
ncbi:UDP-N-acetylglucosamine 2-epimerase [Candidatus Uhrbacteria bacterium RIFCSPHIGHO2_12_FULL_60_25]|uniref:UDP-N-acetylglucosamine 2-epimerase n=1 Tax=Candidatus Uhrbacteria bacterium RIFCSPHIGHO2_12_FULL_60_25 TaxID=1802399 RepID=A0A1F7UKH7_9BACT|nr:MAG: UDP-N-acetylglucosamine 2-epimerase [Candidatus Uhrbacteria bacterium RIFCSPHIGHO2_02_FULL_60_44]OGL78782.1 MAG: UDP-N-acetylglucosamine 2-epimerase [Candidatus Uhrbacteria bacterium RIFCSPHIGHO2_12_FULL_60_25]